MRPNVDLVYFNAGGGHRAAAHALRDMLALQQRPWNVRLVNLTEVLDRQGQFRRLTGLDISQVSVPPVLREQMPASVDEAVGLARENNPRVKEAQADVDAAHGLVESAKGDLYPRIGVDAYGRIGDDLDDYRGTLRDVQARVFLRWNIFDGGINKARKIVEFAAAHGVACSIGSNLELDIATAAMGHLIVACENVQIERYPGDVLGPLYHEFSVVKHPLLIEGPITTITKKPGLGVEVDWDLVRANPVP